MLEVYMNIQTARSIGREQTAGSLLGVIVQYGGQTPLNLARALEEAGVPILGTSPEAIDLAEDRDRFGALLDELEIPAPANGIAHSADQALSDALVELGDVLDSYRNN